MNKDSIISNFLAAKAKTAITILNATGWQEGIINPEALSSDSVFFYVFDYHTKWIWCCSIPKDSFYLAVNKFAKVSQFEKIACCGMFIAECVTKGLNPERENDLALALTAYISITKTYQATDNAAKQNHFAVIWYGQTNNLRPFALGGSARHLLTADLIQNAIKQVVAIDLKNHPEWALKK